MDNIKGKVDKSLTNFASYVYKPARLNFRNGQSFRDMCYPRSTNVYRYNPNKLVVSKYAPLDAAGDKQNQMRVEITFRSFFPQ